MARPASSPCPQHEAGAPWSRAVIEALFLAGVAALAGVGVFGLPLAAQSGASGGDAKRGAEAYRASCGGCHSIDQNRIGPRHRGVVGRKAGTQPGYAYSAALKSSGITWSKAQLGRWLANPRKMVPGTKMAVSVSDAQRRIDIVEYLSTQM